MNEKLSGMQQARGKLREAVQHAAQLLAVRGRTVLEQREQLEAFTRLVGLLKAAEVRSPLKWHMSWYDCLRS